ncbi:hypothetical protein LCGC14_0417180 [marine sediment metagenome]|uniref:Uncharacterized protein n=1 Tax=marine sediment metagenome TaxID=412755 RepID=A0A0F9SY72_9ZZZZ
MKNEGTEQKKGNRGGRPPRYLTIVEFNKFLNNHFVHLKVEVRVALIISITILGVLLTRSS